MALGSNYNNAQLSTTEVLECKTAKLKDRIVIDPSGDNISNIIFNKMLEELTLDLVAEYHRSMKFGYSSFFHPAKGEANKSVKFITCPKCLLLKGISKFQGHLVDCMNLTPKETPKRRAKKDVSYITNTPTDDDDDECVVKRKNRLCKK